MRISDWSSDVCSSDLDAERAQRFAFADQFIEIEARDAGHRRHWPLECAFGDEQRLDQLAGRERSFAHHRADMGSLARTAQARAGEGARRHGGLRSEEHTSEPQSLMRNLYVVCRLKQKNT